MASGAGGHPEAGYKQQWVRTVPETDPVYMQGPSVRGLGPVDNADVQTALVFSSRESYQEGIWHLLAFRSILSKIPAELGGWPGVPGGQEERPPWLQVHP